MKEKNLDIVTDGPTKEELYKDVLEFNATLIHELKTPLREIRLYSEFIEEDNIETLNAQSINDLKSIRTTCDRMMNLIQDMMNYSNVEIRKLEWRNVDLKHLVTQCYNEQMKTYKDHKVQLEILPLPDILADLFLFKILITNILSNSIKYTMGKTQAKITVSARHMQDRLILVFKDNGRGFDMHYAEHIFDAFVRLDSGQNSEGNGIGLATVKRICDRFSGDVQIQAYPGKGCKVEIVLPASMIINRELEEYDDNIIKIGIIGDLSGIASKEERGKYFAYQLAADEINERGGIDGRKIRLIFRDDQSVDSLTKAAVEELTEKEHVNVLMGSTLSPSRDIMRHHAHRTRTLFIDTQQTEGGVASHYTFCLSAGPEQQMKELIRYLIRHFGKKCYVLAADYNYGILSAEWAKYYIREFGGELVGTEYIDRSITDFSAIIDRIIQLKTEVLISICVFPNHDEFYVQWHERGMNHIPNATTQAAAEFMQNVELTPPTLNNTYVMASFIEESDLIQAKHFVERYRKKYGKEEVPYMNMDTETVYSAMYLYKYAVETAGTVETEAVIRALESGRMFFDGPGGRVTVRGEDHHTIRSLTCFRIDEFHKAVPIFRTEPIFSDYIEKMIERKTGIKGGVRALGINAGDEQYNMLLDKIY